MHASRSRAPYVRHYGCRLGVHPPFKNPGYRPAHEACTSREHMHGFRLVQLRLAPGYPQGVDLCIIVMLLYSSQSVLGIGHDK